MVNRNPDVFASARPLSAAEGRPPSQADYWRSALPHLTRQQARTLFSSSSQPLPTFLYRYLCADSKSLRSALVDSQLWMSSHTAFNDPFEYMVQVDIPADSTELERVLLKKLAMGGMELGAAVIRAREIVAEGSARVIHQVAFDAASQSLGIHCMSGPSSDKSERRSTSPRHLLMWPHYADDHKGVCLQFHTTRDPAMFGEFNPIEYSDEFINLPIDADLAQRAFEIKKVLYRKSTAWRYEHEYRRLMEGKANQLVAFRPAALTGLILGVRCTAKPLDLVMDLLQQRAALGLPPLRIFRALRHDSAYRLVIERAREIERHLYPTGGQPGTSP